MKRINLILLESDKLKFDGVENKTQVFKNVLKGSISLFQNKSQGFNIHQSREAIKVLDVIDDCKEDIIEFEDAQYTFMLNILKNISWPENIRLFALVVDSFENPLEVPKKEELKDVEPKK